MKKVRTSLLRILPCSLWILTCYLSSCSSSKKLSSPAVTIHVPDTLPTLPVSEIDLPLKVPGGPLLATADSIVPKEFTSEGWPAYLQTSCDFRYKYRFIRSAFVIGCTNNQLSLQLKGSYQVAGGKCLCAMGKPASPWISGNCGFGNEPMRRVEIGIHSKLNFLSDYRVQTRTHTDPLKSSDKCIMSLFSVDMTPQILDSIQSSLNGFCASLDETLAGMDFSRAIRQTAADALQRTAIGGYGYLAVNPLEIRAGALNYVRDTFFLPVGISCRPQLISDSTRHGAAPPLPPLKAGAKKEGVSLYLQANYDYAFLSKLMNDSLRDHTFLVKGRTVIVKDIAIKGIGGHQVEIKIDFAGSRKGRIYLRGTPVLDTAKQTLSVPDISYSLESKDMALKMARSLLRGKIRRSLKGSSYLDLAALLKVNLPTLDAQLNKPLGANLYSSGHIRELKLIGLLAGEKTLQAQLFVNASLAITGTRLSL
ncbi:MAG TPA: DUF4403 family protein [Puia sp.]|jgi:hypothetical protein|nr:DUF4403 family protein [Puia sp.]